MDDSIPRMRPLATPLMVSGLPSAAMRRLSPGFAALGVAPVDAGSGTARPDGPDVPLEPGSVFAVPLLTGDTDFTAIGTTTEVIGNRVFAFGHPFNGEGAIDLPMGSGEIQTVVANLMSSFKLGSLTRMRGSLRTDQSVGVAGVTGAVPRMIPIEFRVVYADGSEDETYHFQGAVHPKFTPMVAQGALSAALTGNKELPEHHTLDYDMDIDFVGGHSLHLANRSSEVGPAELLADVQLPLVIAAENPFQSVTASKITGRITISDNASTADILAVSVPREKYRPGETVKALVTYRPFRQGEAVMSVEMELPRSLPDGKYQLSVADATQYLHDEQQAEPFRFTAQDARQVFSVLREVLAIRHNALYIRLVRQADGVAVGRTAMPRLPSSRRQVLLDSGRSDITPFTSSNVKVIPTDLVMSGSAQFTITIDRQAKVEVAGAHAVKVESGKSPTTRP